MEKFEDICPSGFTPKGVLRIIDQVATTKAAQYRQIVFYDQDDLAQEVRLKSIDLLRKNKFDPNRSGNDLGKFLSVCADNRIRDIRRSRVYKNNKPCYRCPFWDSLAHKTGKHDCVAYSNKMECDKYRKHEIYVHNKRSAANPIEIDESKIKDSESQREIDKIDLLDFFYKHLPSGTEENFAKIVEFNFNLRAVKPNQREEMILAISGVFDLYRSL